MTPKKVATLVWALVVSFGLLWSVGRTHAQEEVTVQGEVVDMACYMAKGSKGAAHKSCAQMCAKKGVPLGLLTDGGELYLLLDDHDNPAAYDAVKKLAGERAEVKGTKRVKHGMTGIVVGSSKAL